MFKYSIKTTCIWFVVISTTLGGCATIKQDSQATPFEKDQRPAAEYIKDGDRAMRSLDYDEALVQYVLALETGNRDAQTFFKIGTAHRLNGNLALSEAAYDNAIDIDDSHLQSKEGLALVYIRQDKLDTAERLLRTITETEGYQSAEAHNALAILYDLKGNFTDAMRSYEEALALVPNSAEYHNNLGYSYYLQGEIAKARDMFEASLSLDRRFSQAWANLALVHARNGDQAQALRAFEEIGERHQALNNLGYLNILLDNTTGARKNLSESIASSPSYYNTAYKNLDSLELSDKTTNVYHSDADFVSNDDGDEVAVVATLSSSNEQRALASDTAVARQIQLAKVPERQEIPNYKLDYEDNNSVVQQVQEKLTILGYDPGPADGIFGSQTVTALRSYQRNNGYVDNGKLTRKIVMEFDISNIDLHNDGPVSILKN